MIERIQEVINHKARLFKGDIGIGFKDLKTGAEAFYNGDREIYMASTFKTFLLIAFFDLVMKGKLSEGEVYTVTPEDMLFDSTFINQLSPRREFQLIELATLMMILSDNTATDILWRIVGADNVKRILSEIGLKHTTITKNCKSIIMGYYGLLESDSPEEVERKFREWKFKTEVTDKDNVSVARDVTHALDLLYRRQILNAEYCQKALNIMSICILNARIPSFLPMGVGTAHKTGTIDGWVNDVGIVFTKKGDYVLVLYSNSEPWGGIPRSTYGENFLAELSREVYDAYVEG
jgi:beta-lactamase class A